MKSGKKNVKKTKTHTIRSGVDDKATIWHMYHDITHWANSQSVAVHHTNININIMGYIQIALLM